MPEKSLEKSRERLIRLIEPVVYGDIFQFPLTLNEMFTFCTLPLSLEEFEREIENNPDFHGLVSHDQGYYYLKGREHLLEVRGRRTQESERAWRKAYRVVRFIKYVPFVKGMLVTGSLAVNNAKKDDDLDFLVFTSPRRLWFVFFILGVLQRIFSKRYLCPNYYISLDFLPMARKSFYTARELVQARPIYGASACQRFQEENPWISSIFPNAEDGTRGAASENQVVERKGLFRFLVAMLEGLLGGRIGDPLEALLKKLLRQRLFVHYGKHGQKVPEEVLTNALSEVELRFHGLDHEQTINQEMDTRKERVMTGLDEKEPPSETGGRAP